MYRTAILLSALAVFVVGCGAQPVQQSRASQVVLNETVIRAWRAEGHSFEKPTNELLAPAFSDPRSVLRFVLERAPLRGVVYPSERYYYYRFPLGNRLVSGNIRFVDAERGAISVGYFDACNERDMVTTEFSTGTDGVVISFDPLDNEVAVSLDGLTRTFVLDQEAFEPPSFPLLPGEQLISGIRDESGYFLYLIYWQPGRSFYYVLNPAKPLPETWSRGGSKKVETWFGDRSRFCFVRETRSGRYILVGVHRREIMLNSWYDGAFDQVPPRLPIGAILREAYPYVRDAGDIDDHGNFLRMAGQRVAISPYRDYESGPTLETELESLVKDDPTPSAWTAATYEYKRDWKAPSGAAGTGGHETTLSVQWPANHWGMSSRAWGTEHVAALSARWPQNHVLATSRAASGTLPPPKAP